MLHTDLKVIIPGKTKSVKQGKHTYIYYVNQSFYDPKYKCANDKRVCIGKKIPETGFMNPNDNYFTYFSNENIEEILDEIIYTGDVIIGQSMIVDNILTTLELDKILPLIFGTKTKLLISIIKYIVSTQSSVMQQFPYWGLNNDHNLDSIPSTASISRFLNYEVNTDMINKFLMLWSTKLNLSNKQILVSLDSTNMNVSSKMVSIAEYGKPKYNEGLPQVNLAYALDQITGLPLYYDIYPGSINDVSQLKIMIEKGKKYNYNKICFVLDRGYFSFDNIKFIEDNKYDFIMMGKSGALYHEEILNKYKGELVLNPNNLILNHKTHGMKVETKISEKFKHKHCVYLFYDQARASDQTEHFLNYVKYAINTLTLKNPTNFRKLDEHILNTYSNYITFTNEDKSNIIKMEINKESYENIRNQAGYFVIVSNLNIDSEIILEMYRKRDISEKTFKLLKSELDNEKYRVTNDGALETKAFLMFLATIIRSHIGYLVKPFTQLYSSESVNTVLSELAKIKVQKIGLEYGRKYPLSNKQKEILKNFIIDEAHIIKYTNMFKAKIKRLSK